MPRLRHPRSLSQVMPRLRHPCSQYQVMPSLCHPRSQSQVMQGSVLHAVSLWSCKVLLSLLSIASLHITAITLYCRLLYRTAMFVNQRWACSSLMTNIQKSWNLSLYSNNNQQWYNNIWTYYTSVIIYFVQLLHSRQCLCYSLADTNDFWITKNPREYLSHTLPDYFI